MAWLSSYACLQGRAGVSSVQWGGWAGGGMANADSSTAGRLARMGMPLIDPYQGLSALASILSSTKSTSFSCVAAVPFVWPTFLSRLAKQHRAVFLEFAAAPTAVVSELPAEDQGSQSLPDSTDSVMVASEAAAITRDSVHRQVQSAVQAVLGCSIGDVQPLMAGGLDSLGAVELRNSLQSQLGLELPSTVVFDYPTTTALTDFLWPQLHQVLPEMATAEHNRLETEGTVNTEVTPARMQLQPMLVRAEAMSAAPIAIVAIEARCPQDALTSPSGIDTAAVIPLSRWDTNAQDRQMQQPSVRFASTLSHVDAFDTAFFGASSNEAQLMDPQQRLVLECTAAVAAAQGQQDCGVFVGVSSTDYARLTDRHLSGATAYSATSSALSVAAGRVSYTFGFKGPCLSVDTACSSSLVSLHSAVHALQALECSSALNAGVNLTLMPDTPAKFHKAGMLSMTGRCQTLEQAADGYGRAEACVAMWLQTLQTSSNSSSGGGHFLAVVKGSAVKQDGRSSTLTAPNGPSQQEVIRRALEVAAVQPHSIGLTQMHGTGMQSALHACQLPHELMKVAPIPRE